MLETRNFDDHWWLEVPRVVSSASVVNVKDAMENVRVIYYAETVAHQRHMHLNGLLNLNYEDATLVNKLERIQVRDPSSGSTTRLPFGSTHQSLSEFEHVELAAEPILVAWRCHMCHCAGHNALTCSSTRLTIAELGKNTASNKKIKCKNERKRLRSLGLSVQKIGEMNKNDGSSKH